MKKYVVKPLRSCNTTANKRLINIEIFEIILKCFLPYLTIVSLATRLVVCLLFILRKSFYHWEWPSFSINLMRIEIFVVKMFRVKSFGWGLWKHINVLNKFMEIFLFPGKIYQKSPFFFNFLTRWRLKQPMLILSALPSFGLTVVMIFSQWSSNHLCYQQSNKS